MTARHLSDSEVLDIARGLVEAGEAVEHLEGCAECAAKVEQSRDVVELRSLADAAGAMPAVWFRELGAAAASEMEAAMAAAGTEPRPSGTRVVALAARRARSSPASIAFAATGIVALAAAVALFVRTPAVAPPDPSPPSERSAPRVGGLSATLSCRALGGAALAPSDSCPLGSGLEIVADRPHGELSVQSVVECPPAAPCRVALSARSGVSKLSASLPPLDSKGRWEVIVVWSDRELDKAVLDSITHARSGADSLLPRLALPTGWAQVGFAVEAGNGAPH